MDGAMTRQSDWRGRPAAVATARVVVAAMAIGHKSGVSRPAT